VALHFGNQSLWSSANEKGIDMVDAETRPLRSDCYSYFMKIKWWTVLYYLVFVFILVNRSTIFVYI